jgi:hypothetical protein
MSLVGLGSVSDYCSHNLAVPVMVVRPAAAAADKGKKGDAPAAAAEAAEAPAGGENKVRRST